MFEILTSFRTADGLRLDQAIARSVAVKSPPSEMALLDPRHIVEEGVRMGEFSGAIPLFVGNAIRGALDGAVSEIARNASYDVLGYGEQLVTIFDRAWQRQSGDTCPYPAPGRPYGVGSPNQGSPAGLRGRTLLAGICLTGEQSSG